MSENTFNDVVEHGVTVQFFDLKDPLCRFKILLEELWNVSLSDYSIWLQDIHQLDETKNLIEHGIDGEGQVQIKLQLKIKDDVKIINIIDVLKPTEEDLCGDTENVNESVQWVESQEFCLKRAYRGISANIDEWNISDVKFWLQWAIKTFNLSNVVLEKWQITGKELKLMTVEDYEKLIPCDPGGQFWTHLQVLQKCSQIAVSFSKAEDVKQVNEAKVSRNKLPLPNITLWEFLLDLLTEKGSGDIICWVNDEGEFKLVSPEVVASLWGKRKQKANMTYEKMARALRMYYGGIICKMASKKYVYKFLFDVKEIIGYMPMELDKILNES